jgi:hypothetical protein
MNASADVEFHVGKFTSAMAPPSQLPLVSAIFGLGFYSEFLGSHFRSHPCLANLMQHEPMAPPLRKLAGFRPVCSTLPTPSLYREVNVS